LRNPLILRAAEINNMVGIRLQQKTSV